MAVRSAPQYALQYEQIYLEMKNESYLKPKLQVHFACISNFAFKQLIWYYFYKILRNHFFKVCTRTKKVDEPTEGFLKRLTLTVFQLSIPKENNFQLLKVAQNG